MKTKKYFKISYYISLLGLFPYIFIAAISSHRNLEGILMIALLGLVLYLFGAMMSIQFLNTSKEIFKSVDELNELKNKYKNAIDKYSKSSDELIDIILKNYENKEN